MFDISPEPIDIVYDNITRFQKILSLHRKDNPINEANARLNNIAYPLTKRVFPKLFAHKICGVQPIPLTENYLGKIKYRNETIQVLPCNRKIAARWHLEAAQDAFNSQGLDIEEEIYDYVANDILVELNHELIFNLYIAADYSDNAFPFFDETKSPSCVGDENPRLTILINHQCNLIAIRTKHKAGNWCVVNQRGLNALMIETMHNTCFRPYPRNCDKQTHLAFVGIINDSINVYLDEYAGDRTPILIGYKHSDTDASAVYCPYRMITPAGVAFDPTTFEPFVGFMTYGTTYMVSDALGLIRYAN